MYEVSEKNTTLKNDSNLEIKMAVSTDMITEVSSSPVPVATVPSKKTPEGKIISPAKTKERKRANYNKHGNSARPKAKNQLFTENFDRMELTKNPVLSIEKVRVWWKAENGRSMRKVVKENTEVEYDDMRSWGWTTSDYEPGNAIKIENISNINQVSVRYKYPSTSDPRWKKASFKKESVSPDFASGGKSTDFKKSKGYDTDKWKPLAPGEVDEEEDELIDQALIDAGEA